MNESTPSSSGRSWSTRRSWITRPMPATRTPPPRMPGRKREGLWGGGLQFRSGKVFGQWRHSNASMQCKFLICKSYKNNKINTIGNRFLIDNRTRMITTLSTLSPSLYGDSYSHGGVLNLHSTHTTYSRIVLWLLPPVPFIAFQLLFVAEKLSIYVRQATV